MKRSSMDSRLCGARCRDGSSCTRFPVAGSRRCRQHGGLNTGPVTIEGKLKCSRSLIPGRKVGTKLRTPEQREAIAAAKLQRRVAWMERQIRKQVRAMEWERRQRVANGFPLIDKTEPDKEN